MKVSIFIVFIYTSFHIYLYINNGSRYNPQSRGTIFALNDKNNDYFLSEYAFPLARKDTRRIITFRKVCRYS